MKKLILFLILNSSFLILSPVTRALTFPSPTGYVNDFANVLPADTKNNLEQQLINLEKEKGIEFSVVTVKSLEGTTVEDYATRLFESWKIGKKGRDNGLLFLLAPNEKKVRFEVGYGLEGTLNDAKVGRILDDYVIPNFKNGDYAKGIQDGTKAAIAQLSGESPSNLPNPPKPPNLPKLPIPGEVIFFLGIIIVQYVGSFLARSKSFWAGGVLGAALGIVIGLVSHIVLAGLITTVLLGLLGLLLDFILSSNYTKLKKLGRSTGFWSSMGGFSGGRSSGGFGGFGGGSSGGGGSSRGW